ncbi:MAG: ABC transporter ATP-binding protein [Gemmatimonadaceae bacterium]
MTRSRPNDGAPAAEFRNVSRTFGDVRAVNNISLEVKQGEFFSILGPSGCGKTTTLRLLAGFEQPDADGGQIRLLGEVVNEKRPYERKVGMVFQSYALFPHLSVERNIAFGLEQRNMTRLESGPRIRRALEMVRLDPGTYASRMPAHLSGGQRQRVALARALVLEPPILLLDEPLGSIDLQLRKEMQLELKALNQQLCMTFVYVTHDQEEALTMSDRIAVMEKGRIAQIGSPAEIYENPRTSFVARFIGESNFFEGRVTERSADYAIVEAAPGRHFRIPARDGLAAGSDVRVAVRPEWMDVLLPGNVPSGENSVTGTVRDVIYRGETISVIVSLADGADVAVAIRNEGQLIKPVSWKRGDSAAVAWLPEDCQVLEEDS